jgi:hypothetical protein
MLTLAPRERLRLRAADIDELLRFDDDYEAIANFAYSLAQKTIVHLYYEVLEKQYAKIMKRKMGKNKSP